MAGDISQALKDRVRSVLGQPSKQGVLDEHIYLFLNRAQYDLGWRVAEGAMRCLAQLKSDDMAASAIALPEDFWREQQVYVGADVVRAARWPVTQLDALDTVSQFAPAAENPFYYVWDDGEGDVQILVRIGDDDSTDPYDLFYIGTPPSLSGSADPVWPSDLCDLLVMYAVYRFRQVAQQWEEAERVFRAYVDGVVAVNSRYAPGPLEEGAPGGP
jgi:hypothetical protein